MKTIVIGAAASSASSPATIFCAAGGTRMRQCANFAEATCAAAGRRLRRAVNYRKEALKQRLQEFVLELLAVIVLVALFIIVTDPATRKDC